MAPQTRKRAAPTVTLKGEVPKGSPSKSKITKSTAQKRTPKRAKIVKDEEEKGDSKDWTELPQQQDNTSDKENIKTETKNSTATKLPKEDDSLLRSEVDVPKASPPTSKPRKNPYGLTPGQSPYPDYDRPTAEECTKVHELLSKMHGPKWRSKNPPRASAKVSGCGAVPFVVDAVLRTLLSASTTASNAGLALQGLIATFGSIDDSPDWDAVRRAPLPKVVESIKRAGLANMKGANIKAILNTVYERNVQEADKNSTDDPTEKVENIKVEEAQDIKGQSPMLRMKYVENMSDEEAMTELTSLPGIGVKTAACVLMFNMNRDVFAVDTHVFRMCQWLGWVPDIKGVTRDRAFSHLEVHVPNHLKYPLHVQMVMHGRECLRCRANTSPNTEGWDDFECPIDALVKRTGPMKGGSRSGGKNAKASNGRGTGSKSNGSGKSPAKGKRKRRQDSSDESEVEMEETEETEESEAQMDDVTDDEGGSSDQEEDSDEE